MIESVFVILGFTIFVEILFEKWLVFEWLSKIGSQSRFKLIYTLTNCRFCLLFWITCLITLFYFLTHAFQWFAILVPSVVVGLIFLTRKK